MESSAVTITQIVSDVIGVAGQAITFMNANPITWVGIGFGFLGAGIGIVKKAAKVGGRKRG